jgi:NAD+ synthase (glutamine-hydrolysing)
MGQLPSGGFFNLYRHGFVRMAACVPEVRVADPAFNAAQTWTLLERASERGACVALFPELGLTAYSCDDLFQQQALLDAAQRRLSDLLESSRKLPILGIVGLPVVVDGLLYNCGVVIQAGRILGVCPKTYLPNYREFYERRHFASADAATRETIDLCGQHGIPFGNRLLFRAADEPRLCLYVEVCEDLWAPIPPSSFAALAGATVLANLSASNATVGKDEYREELVSNQSGRCLSGYVYCAAGFGESTTDLAWDGHAMAYENGTRIAETERFARASRMAIADLDLDRIVQDRMRQTSFGQAVERHRSDVAGFRTIEFEARLPREATVALEREVARFPFVPSDAAQRAARCREVLDIQVQGLAKRLSFMEAERVVIGISGGLDSTVALAVCALTMDFLALPRSNIVACTMPGFATTPESLARAREIAAALGATLKVIDIRPSCMQMLRDIGHPYALGEPLFDVAFENVQAGERTSHLFRLANLLGAPVVGTSDLSELALGWCTYGVGDQMAHYDVNSSVPRTLMRYLVRHVVETKVLGAAASDVLAQALGAPASPELVPLQRSDRARSTEADLGPYELHDFFLYHTLRFGYSPTKVAFMAHRAWSDAARGDWAGTPVEDRRRYPMAEIRRWLEVFLRRFFGSSQYKRSALPNGPKVGSGGSLSPRGDYRAPSDAQADAWLAQLDTIPADDAGSR